MAWFPAGQFPYVHVQHMLCFIQICSSVMYRCPAHQRGVHTCHPTAAKFATASAWLILCMLARFTVLQILALQQLSNQLAEVLAAVHKAAGAQNSCWHRMLAKAA
jgi:hypothetical protein